MSNDAFLTFLTARGSMPIAALRESAMLFRTGGDYGAGDKYRAYNLARSLDMLGHAEHSTRPKPARLCIAPACLVRLPSPGSVKYLLCGARSSATMPEIRAAAAGKNIRVNIAVSVPETPEPLAPSKVILHFEEEGAALSLAQELQIPIASVPIAWSLCCFTNGAAEFDANLRWRARTISNSEFRFYEASKLSFVSELESEDVRLGVVGESPFFYYMVERDREAPVDDLDWARYRCHSRDGVACIQYDSRRHLFAAPLGLPLPRLLSRALCLCTGDLPYRLGGRFLATKRDSLVYSGVPAEIARKVSEKLEINFIPQPITHGRD